jgi:hypothetical protein
MTHLTGEQELICTCLRRGDSLPEACEKTGIPIAYYRKKYLEPDGIHTNWQSTAPHDIGQSWPELPRRKWEPSDKTTYTFYVSGIVTDDKRYLWPGDLELIGPASESRELASLRRAKDRERVSSLRCAIEREHEPKKIATLKKQLAVAQEKVVRISKPWIQTVPEIKVCNAPPPNLESIRRYARKKYAGNETVLNNSPGIFAEQGGTSSDLEGEIIELAYRYSGEHLHKQWKRILEDAHTNNDRIRMAEYNEELTNAHRHGQRYGRQTPSRGNPDEKTKIIYEKPGKSVSYKSEGDVIRESNHDIPNRKVFCNWR